MAMRADYVTRSAILTILALSCVMIVLRLAMMKWNTKLSGCNPYGASHRSCVKPSLEIKRQTHIMVGIFMVAQRFDQDRETRDLYRSTLKRSRTPTQPFFVNVWYFIGREADPRTENSTYRDIMQGQFSENMNEGKTLHWFIIATSMNPDYVIKMDQDTVVRWAHMKRVAELGPSVYFGQRVYNWGDENPVEGTAPSKTCRHFSDKCWFYMQGGFYGVSIDIARKISKCPFAHTHASGCEDCMTGYWIHMCTRSVRTVHMPSSILYYHHLNDKEHMPENIRMQSIRPMFSTHGLPKIPMSELTHGTVAVRLLGGLGNQLFQAASSYGIATTRQSAWCIQNLDGSVLQQNVRFLVLPSRCGDRSFEIRDEGQEHLEMQGWMMSGSDDIQVGTFLQSYKYFAHVGVPFKLKSESLGRDWVSLRDINVGIHVRRTDQLFSSHGGKDPGVEYYETAIGMLRQKIGGGFRPVVCTDDVAWVKTHALFADMHLYDSGKTPGEDMAVLSACKHVIMSIGTYGWWAAYLRRDHGDGETFYYNSPFLSRAYTYEDHFPDFWTPVSDSDIIESWDVKHTSCGLTVVTAYFCLKSKHTEDEYRQWMEVLLSFDACIIVFTDVPETISALRPSEFRAQTFLVTTNISTFAFDHIGQHPESFWISQHRKDPEALIHKGPLLYKVWASKTAFVDQAMAIDPFDSTHFAWLDIGCTRDGRYRGRRLHTPPRQVLYGNGVFMTSIDQMRWSAPVLVPNTDNRTCIYPHATPPFLVAAGLFVGSRRDMGRLHKAFRAKFEEWAARGLFVGKDMNIFPIICLETPRLCKLSGTSHPDRDEWFETLATLFADKPTPIHHHIKPHLIGCVETRDGYVPSTHIPKRNRFHLPLPK